MGYSPRFLALASATLSCVMMSSCQQFSDAPGPAAGFVPTRQTELVPSDAQLELLWAQGEFTEGGAVGPDGAIYFSDIGNRLMRHDPVKGKVTVHREPSGRGNGMMFGRDGRLYLCEGAMPGGGRRISVADRDGTVCTLADSWEGKRFNSPNDLCLDAEGRLYFTDPRYGGDEPREIEFEGVFLVTPDGTVKLATREVSKPNGIHFSIDGSRVYVADNDSSDGGARHLLVFDVQPDGTLANKSVLFEFPQASRGIDGMTLDVEGNIYATAGRGSEAGIYVFDPEGKHLGFIAVPDVPTNCIFGVGEESRTLYITAQAPPGHAGQGGFGLYRIGLARDGYHVSRR